ncbi:MAG: hypothetical protein WCR52_14475 [Bacteroidota bacterium]
MSERSVDNYTSRITTKCLEKHPRKPGLCSCLRKLRHDKRLVWYLYNGTMIRKALYENPMCYFRNAAVFKHIGLV